MTNPAETSAEEIQKLLEELTKDQIFALCCFYASAYNAGVDSAQEQGFEIYQHIPTIQGTFSRVLCKRFAKLFDDGAVADILTSITIK